MAKGRQGASRTSKRRWETHGPPAPMPTAADDAENESAFDLAGNKVFREYILKGLSRLTVDAIKKPENNGKVPYGWWKNLVDNNMCREYMITSETARMALRKYRPILEDEDRVGPVTVATAGLSTPNNNSEEEEENNNKDDTADANEEGEEEEAEAEEHTDNAPKTRKKGGRPRGSTNFAKEDLERRKEAAVYDASKAYAVARSKKSPVDPGTLQKCISDAKQKHHLDDEVVINAHTVRSRTAKGEQTGEFSASNLSPMSEIEPLLVSMVIASYYARIKVTKSVFLKMANDLIRGTQLEQDVIDWKKKHSYYEEPTAEEAARVGRARLGRKYYRGFMRRHKDQIRAMKAKQTSLHTIEWATYRNFLFAYHDIYDYMVEFGVAEQFPVPVFMNKKGEIVDENDPDQFGCQVLYKLVHPERMLVADETGNSTNQDQASNNQERLLGPAGHEVRVLVPRNTKHYTIVPFNNLLGELVCVAVIFAHSAEDESVPMAWKHPVDWFKFDEYYQSLEEDEQDELMELVKGYDPEDIAPELKSLFDREGICHGPPPVQYKDKEIPWFIASSPKGSITSSILLQILMHLNELEVFERTDDLPGPMLLVDAHGSRFGSELVEYICQKETRWGLCHCVPACTRFWQFGDGTRHNGLLKVKTSEWEQHLMTIKYKYGIKQNLTHLDTIPVLCRALPPSFANPLNGLKTLAECGWNPLNFALLTHSEILKSKPEELVEDLQLIEKRRRLNAQGILAEGEGQDATRLSAEEVEAMDGEEESHVEPETMTAEERNKHVIARIVHQVNLVDVTGFSGQLLAEVFIAAEEGIERERRAHIKRKGIANAFQRVHKKLTGGINWRQGPVGMGNTRIGTDALSQIKEKERDAVVKRIEIEARKTMARNSLLRKVYVALHKIAEEELLAQADKKALLQWKKQPDDVAISKLKGDELKKVFAEWSSDNWKGREEPAFPSLTEDDATKEQLICVGCGEKFDSEEDCYDHVLECVLCEDDIDDADELDVLSLKSTEKGNEEDEDEDDDGGGSTTTSVHTSPDRRHRDKRNKPNTPSRAAAMANAEFIQSSESSVESE